MIFSTLMSTVLYNTFDLILLVTIYQCFLFALFLVALKKGNRQNNILLALFLLAHAAIPLDTLINFGEAFREYAISVSPNVFYVFGSTYWLESVLLLFYVRSLIYKNYSISKRELIYFLPFISYCVYELFSWYLLDNQTKLALLNNYQLASEPSHTRYITLFRECFRMFCGIVCLVEIRNYQRRIKDQMANIEDVDLTWLKVLVVGFSFIRFIAILIALSLIFSFQLHITIDFEALGLFANFSTMALISFLIFFSLGFTNIFKGIEQESNLPAVKEPLDPQLKQTLLDHMEAKQPYLDHLLTLDLLAKQTAIAPRTLSQLINREFALNFYEFINSYRIAESKRLLVDTLNPKMTVLEVMDRSGFNSKATFNTFFKKATGCTPTQYRKSNRLE